MKILHSLMALLAFSYPKSSEADYMSTILNGGEHLDFTAQRTGVNCSFKAIGNPATFYTGYLYLNFVAPPATSDCKLNQLIEIKDEYNCSFIDTENELFGSIGSLAYSSQYQPASVWINCQSNGTITPRTPFGS